MPRINVTEEELAFLERVRHTRAKDLAWNEAIDRATSEILGCALPPATGPALTELEFDTYRQAMREFIARTIASLKKDISL